MRSHRIALALSTLPLLLACSTTDNDVGDLGADAGDTARATGGVTTGTGGDPGSGGVGVTSNTGGTSSSSGGASGGTPDVPQDAPTAAPEFTVAGCKADTCGAEARLCGWGASDAKYLGCLRDCEMLGLAGVPCPEKAAALYICASLGAKVDCTTGKGTGCAAEEQQAMACFPIDGGSDVPASTVQHPYAGSAACFNTPITSYRGFPYDPSARGAGAWPTCPLNCNAVLATAGTVLAPLDQALPDGPCDDDGATCDSPLMAGWSAPCADTGGPGNGYTCTCRAKKWQCALVSPGMNQGDPPRCLDPTLTIPVPSSCSQITWSATQVCGCGVCRDLCTSDADCLSGHCNPNQVCHATGTCAGPDDCSIPCTGLCAPALTDGSPPSKGLGASCSVLVDASANQGVFNTAATECSSGLCLKPVVDPTVVGTVDTAPFCTAECSTDDDCAGGLIRDPSNPSDKGCKSGYTCGIPFVKGPLCCKKECICMDFTGGGMGVPTACTYSAEITCSGDPLTRIKDALLGTWSGTALTPYEPSYPVIFTFDSYTHYSAKATDGRSVALFWGIDADSPLKQYDINEVSDSGEASGTIDIVEGTSVFRSRLERIVLTTELNELSFRFLHNNESYQTASFHLQRVLSAPAGH